MELKFTDITEQKQAAIGSNRTFMELKSNKTRLVHIVLWRSNRTFMELKLNTPKARILPFKF